MALDAKAKDFLLKSIKAAIDGLQERSFDGMKKLVSRLHSVSEVFPDDTWTKELNLVCISLVVIGTSTEGEIAKLKKEKADELIKNYSGKLNEFYGAIEEESIAKTDTFLKEFVDIFFRDIGM
jgi:hypothetical protein